MKIITQASARKVRSVAKDMFEESYANTISPGSVLTGEIANMAYISRAARPSKIQKRTETREGEKESTKSNDAMTTTGKMVDGEVGAKVADGETEKDAEYGLTIPHANSRWISYHHLKDGMLRSKRLWTHQNLNMLIFVVDQLFKTFIDDVLKIDAAAYHLLIPCKFSCSLDLASRLFTRY